MSVLIGDLMAAAEEYEPSGRKKKSKKRGGGKRKLQARRGVGGAGDPFGKLRAGSSARKGRGLQDDRPSIPEPRRTASLRTQGRLPQKRMGELSELDFLRKTVSV